MPFLAESELEIRVINPPIMYMIHIPLNDPMLLVTSASQIFADIYA